MAMRRALRIALVGVVLACGGEEPAADDAYDHVLPFDTARVRVVSAADTAWLTVQLALSDAQKTLGLMERRHLPDTAGMLFVYDTTQPDSSGFWMFRTRLPLDIAFLDSAGVIRAIRRMAPCESPLARGCPAYAAGVPYRAALEVNAGYFERRGIRVGDRVLGGGLPAAKGP
jgi:uncharacterized membrane protein (UPF0127 family)